MIVFKTMQKQIEHIKPKIKNIYIKNLNNIDIFIKINLALYFIYILNLILKFVP